MKIKITIKNVVFLILLSSVAYVLCFFNVINSRLLNVVSMISKDNILIFWVIFSSIFMIVGHIIRSIRGKFLFNVVMNTTIRDQFKAFSIGVLCNLVSPFKIGELIRTDILAQQYKISFSFSLILIVIERAFDCLILVILMFLLFGRYSFFLFSVTFVLFCFVILIWKSPLWVKRCIRLFSGLFKDEIKSKVMFSYWTANYGLRKLVNLKNVFIYMFTTIINWCIYLFALYPIIRVLTKQDLLNSEKISLAALYGATLSGILGALGRTYSETILTFNKGIKLEDLIIFWIVIAIPTAIIGFILTVKKIETLSLFRIYLHKKILKNKLLREADISKNQMDFLEKYFSNDVLARKIAENEINDLMSLNQYFKGGGSKAITILSEINNKKYVIKMIMKSESQSLREQYDWLYRFSHKNVVGVVDETEDKEMYAIRIEYDGSAIDGYDYVHFHSDVENQEIFDTVLKFLFKNVYEKPEEINIDEGKMAVRNYIDTHIYGCLDKAVQFLSDLKSVYEQKTLIINGIEYMNVYPLLEKILNNSTIICDLANFRKTNMIHGDLILDNIIYSESKQTPVIIDPVPNGNFFNGPVFDFGKIHQSLCCGYEFLLRDKSLVKVKDQNIINYKEYRSEKYERLWKYVYDYLAEVYLTSEEKRTVLFIGATNYFRRLKHQAVQCPDNTLKFYAVGVRYLNEYVRLYDGL